MTKENQELLDCLDAKRKAFKNEVLNEIEKAIEKAENHKLNLDDLEVLTYTGFEYEVETFVSVERENNSIIFKNEYGVKFELDDIVYGEFYWILCEMLEELDSLE